MAMDQLLQRVKGLGEKGNTLSVEEVRELIQKITTIFVTACVANGFDKKQITKVTTKLRDAGRRSPPWKPVSSRVPGRPQDGADGNRILRWKLAIEHKFYADEMAATLTEVKYYLQLLSMDDAPALPENTIQTCFNWLIENEVRPGLYRDPVQLIPISLKSVMDDARTIQSGHLHPLDRGGKHEPKNAFLMLNRSNQLQGNLTLEELIGLMQEIVNKHSIKNK